VGEAPAQLPHAGAAGDRRGGAPADAAASAPADAAAALDDPGCWPWAHLHADALVGLGRADEAEAVLARHERIADARGARAMRARLARVRTALHLLRDEHEAADAAITLAAATLPEGLPYERALIGFVHGRLLRRSGHRREAAHVLAETREQLAALGARPLLERCVRELDACGLAPIKRGAGVDRSRLTPQERSVAHLVATGRSNRDVAAELLVSVKTVERHLTSVYRKLGVGSRTELTAIEITPRPER
ncbi:helix-turn-helix transcriptional regulator, partial [Solirubrobacter phytolaccae]